MKSAASISSREDDRTKWSGRGEDALTRALKSAKVTKPVTVQPAARLGRPRCGRRGAGTEPIKKGQYTKAKQEDRAASLWTRKTLIFMWAAPSPDKEKKWDDGVSEREAVPEPE